MKTKEEILHTIYQREYDNTKPGQAYPENYPSYVLEAMEEYCPKWVNVEERLPRISDESEYARNNSLSITVPVIEKGVLRLGYFNYPLNCWQVEGRIGNIKVTSWFDLPFRS